MRDLTYRIGFDAGGTRLEDALEWAAASGLHFVDFNADVGPNHLDEWSDQRVRAVRQYCESHDIHLGVHTLSGVNVAEFSPLMSPAADEYLRANVSLARRLDCEWVTVHAGYHFSAALEGRQTASLERLKRATAFAEANGRRLLLENLNFEPDDAEVHYLAHNVDECRRYFDSIESEAFGWAFTVNHANLVPEGIDGFIDAFGISRVGCVRLADNHGTVEVHEIPGEGNIDFARMFGRLDGGGYTGHFTMAYGSGDEKLASREWLVAQAAKGTA